MRRGAAYAKLGMYTEGVHDYEQALQISDDPKVRFDMEAMKVHA